MSPHAVDCGAGDSWRTLTALGRTIGVGLDRAQVRSKLQRHGARREICNCILPIEVMLPRTRSIAMGRGLFMRSHPDIRHVNLYNHGNIVSQAQATAFRPYPVEISSGQIHQQAGGLKSNGAFDWLTLHR